MIAMVIDMFPDWGPTVGWILGANIALAIAGESIPEFWGNLLPFEKQSSKTPALTSPNSASSFSAHSGIGSKSDDAKNDLLNAKAAQSWLMEEIKLRKQWDDERIRMIYDIQDSCEEKCLEGDKPCEIYERLKAMCAEDPGRMTKGWFN